MQKLLLKIILSFTLLPVVNAAAEDPVQVVVHSPSVVTDKQLITIQDLATVTGGTVAQRNRISKLDVEVFSHDVSKITISRRQIEVRIELSRIDKTPTMVMGTETVTVLRHAKTELPAQLESIVRTELSKQFNLKTEDINVSLLKGQQTKKIAGLFNPRNMKGTAIFPAQLPLGQQMVRLELEDDKANHLSISLRFRIVINREVLVTKTTIPRGTVLTAAYFERIRRPMDDANDRLASMDQLIGKVATRPLQENLVMQTNFVSEQQQFDQYLVKRNSYVDVVKVLGKLEIRWKNARVLTPGRLGDTVEVVNLRNNQKLVGIVQDESTVIVR